MIKNGSAQAIFPPHYFPSKRPFINQYSVPLMTELSAVFCNETALKARGMNIDVNLLWPDSFMWAKFALSRGGKMGSKRFWQAITDKRIKANEVNGPKNAIEMMLRGRVDYHINDLVTVAWYLNSILSNHNPELKHKMKLVKIIAEEAGYLATSTGWEPAQSEEFMIRFNRQFLLMHNDGIVTDIIEKYAH